MNSIDHMHLELSETLTLHGQRSLNNLARQNKDMEEVEERRREGGKGERHAFEASCT
jgi:hypothetical protein